MKHESVCRCQKCWAVIKKTQFIFYEQPGDLRCAKEFGGNPNTSACDAKVEVRSTSRYSLGTGSAWIQVLCECCLLKLTGQAIGTEACPMTEEIVDRPVSLGNFLSILGHGFVSAAGCRVSGIAL